jgi:hypothetical protein
MSVMNLAYLHMVYSPTSSHISSIVAKQVKRAALVYRIKSIFYITSITLLISWASLLTRSLFSVTYRVNLLWFWSWIYLSVFFLWLTGKLVQRFGLMPKGVTYCAIVSLIVIAWLLAAFIFPITYRVNILGIVIWTLLSGSLLTVFAILDSYIHKKIQ